MSRKVILKRKKKARKPPVEWKYEIVEAEEPLDVDGLAELLAHMIMDAYEKGFLREKKNALDRQKVKQHGE